MWSLGNLFINISLDEKASKVQNPDKDRKKGQKVDKKEI